MGVGLRPASCPNSVTLCCLGSLFFWGEWGGHLQRAQTKTCGLTFENLPPRLFPPLLPEPPGKRKRWGWGEAGKKRPRGQGKGHGFRGWEPP